MRRLLNSILRMAAPMVRVAALMVLVVGWPSEVRSQTEDARIRSLESQVMAPCCWSQTVADHRSAAAEEVRQKIRQSVRAGMDDEAILASFISTYGKRILAQPEATGFDTLVYVLPPVFLAGGAALVWFLLRKLAAGGSRGTKASRIPETEAGDLRARVEREVAQREL